ncbi:ParB N-terminal domain-containing protein [Staphylococcus chromogenes]|uniref:ParB N-terminal domain-containing protein n=1 Tax=Staphylococcus chromogenes TaxID=46126 RepID=UPI0021CF0CC3|nr:ParB N-terminal domain-containing protein [Staphylococcus chromogenes]UXS76327.1 ParB N-terminal domain-containing protein [Staphylococcus chromogenes]
MKEIENIEISKLKFDDDINKLVPEMTKKEFEDLVVNIEMQGQHTPIHINWDNTILDGRHRVKALKELKVTAVKAIRENFEKDEALKFVRDTAVERRSLTTNQKLDIVLNAKDLIGDIQERARERKLSTLKQNKPFSSAEPNGETKDDIRFDSAKSKRKQEPIQNIDKTPKTNQFDTPVQENKELAELAGVSKSTVMRAKKVKREAPEVYEKVIKENSGWNKAYNELPSVKNKEYQKQLKNKRVEVETEMSDEELELIAQSQTLVKRFHDLALCASSATDIIKVVEKALETDSEEVKKTYFVIERLFTLIGLKIETYGGTKNEKIK